MDPLIVIQLAFLLLAVLQQQTNAAGSSGLILLSCPDTSHPDPIAGPSFDRGQTPVRRDDYSYTPGIGGHKFHTRAATWNDARRTCVEEGGHLAVINSVAEANVISNLYNKSRNQITGSNGGMDWAHIGFHDLYQKGEYVTIHSHSLAKAGYAEWKSGEPSGHLNGADERCGSVHETFGLNDIKCTDKVAFICELPIF